MTAPLYQTTDPCLAGFLLSRGHAPVSWRRLTPKKVLFRFEAGEELHDLLRLYWSGQPVLISPIRLFAAFRRLKSRALVRMGSDLLHDGPARADASEPDDDDEAGVGHEPADLSAFPGVR